MSGLNASSLPPEVYDEVVRGLKDATGIRYLSAIGLVLLLCDHIQTLPEEIRLVWRANASVAKFLFLANRYLVLASLLAVTHALCGFNGAVYSDRVSKLMLEALHKCGILLSYVTATAVISLGIANLLVSARVLLLWDANRRVLVMLGLSYLVSYILAVGFLIASIFVLQPGIQWSPIARTCAPTTKSHFYTAVWACPFLFELMVLVLTLINAISRPRSESMHLSKTLHQDGILFFLVLTSFRVVNLIFSTSQYPERVNYAGPFVWAMITITLNRLLLHIRASEIRLAAESAKQQQQLAADAVTDEDDGDEPLSPDAIVLNGRASPFGIPLPIHQHRGRTSHDAEALPATHVEMHSFYR